MSLLKFCEILSNYGITTQKIELFTASSAFNIRIIRSFSSCANFTIQYLFKYLYCDNMSIVGQRLSKHVLAATNIRGIVHYWVTAR
jgi:hypothetical protein